MPSHKQLSYTCQYFKSKWVISKNRVWLETEYFLSLVGLALNFLLVSLESLERKVRLSWGVFWLLNQLYLCFVLNKNYTTIPKEWNTTFFKLSRTAFLKCDLHTYVHISEI